MLLFYRSIICALLSVAALQRSNSASGLPLAFGTAKVAPAMLSSADAASVDLYRVANGGWAALQSDISHWFSGVGQAHTIPSQGSTLSIDKHVLIENMGQSSGLSRFKIINKSDKWQNVKFDGQPMVHIVAPKSIETVVPDGATASVQTYPLSQEQASVVYRYNIR